MDVASKRSLRSTGPKYKNFRITFSIFIGNPLFTVRSFMLFNQKLAMSCYIKNNMDEIVDYRARQKMGLVFTSNMAESTVESLINQRCKGQQHMRWSREGLNPVCN